ncbi:MAG: hypothetical protein NC338_00015 [Firmicutes bacterium]|nr:hypothetical protein [Bacillota bacterium]MCM1402044.1 hypothetical protein [Bacteroides sp.]MCM1476779.1 hypothetical protein [Bacteroides sp.]
MEEKIKHLISDPDGLATYEFIANNIESIDPVLASLVDNMIRVDASGQFTVSAARYLNAIDSTKYSAEINRLISAAIDKDREHVYIGSLLSDIWGPDYASRIDSLNASDNNFRRIYKRLYPASPI